MRLGLPGLGLREYLQSVCVGILPEDRLIESRPVGGARSLVEVLPMGFAEASPRHTKDSSSSLTPLRSSALSEI